MEGGQEKKTEKSFMTMHRLLSIFKKKMYPELENFLKDYDTVDLGTNLIRISEEFLRQRFRFKMIRADEDKTIELWGNWEDSGEQDYAIRYEVETEKLSFEKL